MMKSVDIFFKFMWNRWTEQVCKEIFDEWKALHIWNVWLNIRDDYDATAAPAVLWAYLDSMCKNAICDYIIKIGYRG